MELTLQALEQALAPIEAVGQGEIEFPVGDTPVILRLLLPEEETEVQRYASVSTEPVMAEGGKAEEGKTTVLDYLERYKVATLSYAIVQAGKMDLHGVRFVETGDKLGNGVAVKERLHEAMRKLVLKSWTGPIRTALFGKYAELQRRIEARTEKLVKFDPADLDSEIERVGRRLIQLKEEREKGKAAAETQAMRIVRAVGAVDTSDRKERSDDETELTLRRSRLARGVPAEGGEGPEVAAMEGPGIPVTLPERDAAPAAALGRMPITPDRARSIPAPNAPTMPTPPPESAPVRPSPTPGLNPEEEEVYDSLVDASDPAAMDEAIRAENQRIMAARMATRRGPPVPAQPASAQTAVHAARRPPHLDALEVSRAEAAPEPSGLQGATYVGEAGGVPAYRTPTGVLTQHPAIPAATPAPINRSASDTAGRNPRFRPAR